MAQLSNDSSLASSSSSSAQTRARPRARWRRHWRAGVLGVFAGLATSACVLEIGDSFGDGGGEEVCWDNYGDCMDDVEHPHEIVACNDQLDACLASCGKGADDGTGGYETDGESASGGSGGDGDGDGGSTGATSSGGSGDGDGDGGTSTGGDGDGDGGTSTGGDGDGDGDGDPPHATTGAETGDGDGDPPHATTGGTSGDGDGDGDPIDPACYDILAACIDAAETLQDIDACEALFDNCAYPPPCDDPDCQEPGCPQEALDACVDDYGWCSQEANSEAEVIACASGFDECTAGFDLSLCLPNYDDELVAACLEQNELCVACAPGPDELAACQTAFDNCLEA